MLRLYRLDVKSHSNLTLKLSAPSSADFNVQLRNINGRVIECACGDSGSQTLQHQLKPGRYYAVVSVHDNSSGNFTLVRESRTITSTRLSFGAAHGARRPERRHRRQGLARGVGPVTVDIERFDPVFGWQFYRQSQASRAAARRACRSRPRRSVAGVRRPSYGGSRTFSPSAVGFSYLLVS